MTQYSRPIWLGKLEKPSDPALVNLPIQGEMMPYIGKQYSAPEIYNLDYHNFEDQSKLEWVRAYQIPALLGQIINIHHPDELSAKMNILIQETLTEVAWEPFEVSTATFRKYFIVHFEVSAPPDLQTGQAMGLEVFAELVTVNGEAFSSEAGQTWKHEQQLLQAQAQQSGQPEPELKGDFEIEVKSATYSNIRYPGINVPIYL